MRIPNLFSKRSAPSVPTKLTVDELSPKFRMQAGHVLRRALGKRLTSSTEHLWRLLHDSVAEAHGLPNLGRMSHYDVAAACLDYLAGRSGTAEALDVIEVGFRVVEVFVPKMQPYERDDAGISTKPDDAIEDLNAYFAENGIGYRYRDRQILRVDSELLHAEVTTKAFTLLHVAGFGGPEQEFRTAHDHHRHGRFKEAVTDALKAFESTMKSIAAARQWGHKPGAAAKELIALMFEKQLIPPFMETQFAGLRQLLESGAPTIRNKMSGHGQGPVPVEMPAHLSALALHIAAANIVFLTEAHAALK